MIVSGDNMIVNNININNTFTFPHKPSHWTFKGRFSHWLMQRVVFVGIVGSGTSEIM